MCAGKKSRVSWSRSLFGQMMEATGMKLGGEQYNQLCTCSVQLVESVEYQLCLCSY